MVFSLRYHNEGFTVVNSDTSPRMIFHHYEFVARSLQCWTFLAVSLVFCCATITVHVEAAEENVWLSDVGSLGADVEIGNQTVVYGIPGSVDQEMHVWLQTAFAAQNLTAVDLNMIATNSSILEFTGVTVENPEYNTGGCTNSPNNCRWDFTHHHSSSKMPGVTTSKFAMSMYKEVVGISSSKLRYRPRSTYVLKELYGLVFAK